MENQRPRLPGKGKPRGWAGNTSSVCAFRRGAPNLSFPCAPALRSPPLLRPLRRRARGAHPLPRRRGARARPPPPLAARSPGRKLAAGRNSGPQQREAAAAEAGAGAATEPGSRGAAGGAGAAGPESPPRSPCQRLRGGGFRGAARTPRAEPGRGPCGRACPGRSGTAARAGGAAASLHAARAAGQQRRRRRGRRLKPCPGSAGGRRRREPGAAMAPWPVPPPPPPPPPPLAAPPPPGASAKGPPARKLLFMCTLSLSVTYLCYNLLGGSGSLQFPLALQEPPGAAAEPPPSPPPPSLPPPPVRLGAPSQPPAPPPDNESRVELTEPPEQPPAPGADGWGLASGSGGARDAWLRTPPDPSEMTVVQSALLERDAPESSTTDEELAGRRAANGSSERGGAASTPDYGEKKLPQALIIGVKKGGTRALLEAIRVHPDVRAVGVEPHFFDRNYEKGLEWYRNVMPKTVEGQITMEKTPSYFVTNEAPKRIHSMAKDIKLIVVVRNPVTRAISDYTQTLSKKPEIPTFEVLAFKNRTLGLIDASWSAIRIGLYALHLENWMQFFPLSQILFVSGERLIVDPAGEMAKVQDFLGLTRVVTEKHFYFNKTKGFPCLKKPEDSSTPRCLGKSKGRTHPRIDPDVIHRLRKFYKPFNMMFYQMTGQNFQWEQEEGDK